MKRTLERKGVLAIAVPCRAQQPPLFLAVSTNGAAVPAPRLDKLLVCQHGTMLTDPYVDAKPPAPGADGLA